MGGGVTQVAGGTAEVAQREAAGGAAAVAGRDGSVQLGAHAQGRPSRRSGQERPTGHAGLTHVTALARIRHECGGTWPASPACQVPCCLLAGVCKRAPISTLPRSQAHLHVCLADAPQGPVGACKRVRSDDVGARRREVRERQQLMTYAGCTACWQEWATRCMHRRVNVQLGARTGKFMQRGHGSRRAHLQVAGPVAQPSAPAAMYSACTSLTASGARQLASAPARKSWSYASPGTSFSTSLAFRRCPMPPSRSSTGGAGAPGAYAMPACGGCTRGGNGCATAGRPGRSLCKQVAAAVLAPGVVASSGTGAVQRLGCARNAARTCDR